MYVCEPFFGHNKEKGIVLVSKMENNTLKGVILVPVEKEHNIWRCKTEVNKINIPYIQAALAHLDW